LGNGPVPVPLPVPDHKKTKNKDSIISSANADGARASDFRDLPISFTQVGTKFSIRPKYECYELNNPIKVLLRTFYNLYIHSLGEI